MEIVEKDFKLKPVNESSSLFDLELLYKVKPRGGEVRYEFKNAGYGCRLVSAIEKIVNYRINNKHQNDAISLKEYFKEFIENIKDIKKSIDTTEIVNNINS